MMLPRNLLRVLLALSAAAVVAGAVAATSVALPSAGKPPAPALVSPAQMQAEGAARRNAGGG